MPWVSKKYFKMTYSPPPLEYTVTMEVLKKFSIIDLKRIKTEAISDFSCNG